MDIKANDIRSYFLRRNLVQYLSKPEKKLKSLIKFKRCYYFCFVIVRKIFISAIISIYFAFTCGVLINFHFCMGRYSSLHFYEQPGKSCARCGMAIKNPRCCHDEIKIVKLNNAHQHSFFAYTFEDIQPLPARVSEFLTTLLVSKETGTLEITHSPPLISQQDTYLQNSVFRI